MILWATQHNTLRLRLYNARVHRTVMQLNCVRSHHRPVTLSCHVMWEGMSANIPSPSPSTLHILSVAELDLCLCFVFTFVYPTVDDVMMSLCGLPSLLLSCWFINLNCREQILIVAIITIRISVQSISNIHIWGLIIWSSALTVAWYVSLNILG